MKPSTSIILSIGSRYFAVTSARKAAQLFELLASLEPVEAEYESGDIGFYYHRAASSRFHDINIKFNVPLYPGPRRLGLPAPSGDTLDPSNPHRG